MNRGETSRLQVGEVISSQAINPNAFPITVWSCSAAKYFKWAYKFIIRKARSSHSPGNVQKMLFLKDRSLEASFSSSANLRSVSAGRNDKNRKNSSLLTGGNVSLFP